MTRQLNLRVDAEFAERLERHSRKMGRSMAAVLESIGTPASAAAEADIQFEAEALAAWEEYELTGSHVPAELARPKKVSGGKDAYRQGICTGCRCPGFYW